MSLLSVEPPPPSAFTVSAKLLVLNAALFHSCASASPGFMRPAAAASASTPAPLPAFNTWRWLFLAGLVAGAGAWLWLAPPAFAPRAGYPLPLVLLAGVLVGFGTAQGGGCTSGHGVCGISRLSARSIVATLTFLVTGMASVFVVRHLLGVAS